MDIYQQIWDADQSGNGVKPILAGAGDAPETGYVRVVNTDDPGTSLVISKSSPKWRYRTTR